MLRMPSVYCCCLFGLLPILPACHSAKTGADPCTPCQSTAPTAAAGAATTTPPPRSPELDELAERRLKHLRKRLEILNLEWEHGMIPLDQLLRARREIAFAARDSGLRGESLRRELTAYADSMVALVQSVESGLKSGTGTTMAEVEDAKAMLAEAEYWLAEASEQ